MGEKKQKFYVVWKGRTPGIYDSWEECEKQTHGVAAQYRAYPTREEAEAAFAQPYVAGTGGKSKKKGDGSVTVDANGMTVVKEGTVGPVLASLAVDAACSGNPGVMEYQGVYVASRARLFHFKAPVGTNNIGEFLAIVHGLGYLKKHNLDLIMYSDSVNAISWVRQKKCRSKLVRNAQTEELWQLVKRAENWLNTNVYTTEIRKWETERWGEIPADFGRK